MIHTRASRRATVIIAFLAFVSLGLPDAVLGIACPSMRRDFGVPLSAAVVRIAVFPPLAEVLARATSLEAIAAFLLGLAVALLALGEAGDRTRARVLQA